MNFIRLLIAALLLAGAFAFTSCRHQKETTSGSVRETISPEVAGGKGTSFQDAVIILDSIETSGIAAEYAWLRVNYPGYKMQQQALVYNEGKPYDILYITTDEGEDKKVYFDISHFFGKF